MVRSMAHRVVVPIMVQILMQLKMLVGRLRELVSLRVVLLPMEFIVTEVLVEIAMRVAIEPML